ncbi:hypothetical protein DICPUDRAFT_76110 [Dictyostelium purpureum]|uniref:RCR-type E3 ubiquitin transferase n=1 Tax=Dictyostelium purpureum TaxID=5786 RepID=F0ZCM3_DICPU|nr:uncharacterized protein DICPUDRAFT_76110 [Dictyostelium purpureum]EGC38296.1 hypothetical protein DICPUDRAFT_76110 [Dictyostelium purpureum]|eukprot:XP_003285157.1 hypothetical protein DICPUDRAFT_76110 [Dictyostelium purpureum]
MEFKSFLFDYNNNKDFFDQIMAEKSNNNINNNRDINKNNGINNNFIKRNQIYNNNDFQDNFLYSHFQNNLGLNDDNEDADTSTSNSDSNYSRSSYSSSNSDTEDDHSNSDKNEDSSFSLTNNWLFNKFFKSNNNNNNNNNSDNDSSSSEEDDSDSNYINYDITTFLNNNIDNNNNPLEFLNSIKKDYNNNNNNGSLTKGEMFSKISESPFNLLLRDNLELERQVSSSIPIPTNKSNNNNNNKSPVYSSPLSSSFTSSPPFKQSLKLDDDENINNNILIDESNNELVIKCVECSNTPSLVDDIIFLDCSHFYCRKCLYGFIMNRIKEKKVSKIKCKSCKIPLSVHDIKQVLNEEECSIYDKASLDQVLSKNKGNYIQCPCCNLFIEKVIIPAPSPKTTSFSSSYNGGNSSNKNKSKDSTCSSLPNFSSNNHHHHHQKVEYDDNGRPLSKESMEHKRKYRLRCPQCSTVFCSECFVTPYHLGYTCAQYQIYNSSKHCRFCKIAIFPILPNSKILLNNNGNTTTTTTPNLETNVLDICSNNECRLKSLKSCDKVLKCGHQCLGLKNEENCLPCIESDCNYNKINNNNNVNNNINSDVTILKTDQKSNDYCNICWTDDLSSDPCIQLDCGHIFHYKCCKNVLKKRWSSPRISFGFTKCALCSQTMDHPSLKKYLDPINELYNTIKTKALTRLEINGPEQDVNFNDTTSKWYNNKEGYVMERFSYFMCFKCKKPYFGGEKACGDNRQDFKPEELICGGCSANGNEICKIHGKEFIEYKCKYCCNISIFFCWGKTHFCADCHKKVNEVTKTPKHLLPQCKCDVEVKHQVGEEFCFGCTLCIISDN